MISRLIRRILGQFCELHDRRYTSDFCPSCVEAWFARLDKIDGRPEWHESDVTWRKKNAANQINDQDR